MTDLWIALSLVAVFEGLILFAFPDAWRRAVIELLAFPPQRLRLFGAIAVACGLVCLFLLRRG